jgi:hypothetical protein
VVRSSGCHAEGNAMQATGLTALLAVLLAALVSLV